MRRIIVAGIGTDVGKTIASAILVQAIQGVYWKPVQCGNLENSDSQVINKLTQAEYFPEAYRSRHPLSPHHAAKLEDRKIDYASIQPPKTQRPLIIEMAGGLLVPYDKDCLQIDLFSQWDAEWILVTQHYLGSINHTLLSLEAIKKRNLKLLGIVINGNSYPEAESLFCQPLIGRIHPEKSFTPEIIAGYAQTWNPQLL